MTGGPTPTTPPTSGNHSPLGSSGGTWNLKFNDEFNATSVDRSKFPECHWATRPGCTGQNPKEMQAYRPGNVTVSGGSAHLTAKRENVRVPELNSTFNYTSGSLATGSWAGKPSTFKMQYGYVEARMKTAPGKGMWSSLWLASADMEWPPEIDIVEAPNHNEHQAHSNVHFKNRDGSRGQAGSSYTSSRNLSQSYHVYGLEWTPTQIKWYIDGRLVRTYSNSNNVPKKEMYIVANLSVGGVWAGAPTSSTKFPATMSVDYIRAWQR